MGMLTELTPNEVKSKAMKERSPEVAPSPGPWMNVLPVGPLVVIVPQNPENTVCGYEVGRLASWARGTPVAIQSRETRSGGLGCQERVDL